MRPPQDLESVLERRDRVVALTRLGFTAAQISTELGITTRSVVRHRSAAGCAQSPGRPLTAEEKQIIEDLLADGCSVAEIARTLGRSKWVLWPKYRHRGWTWEQVLDFNRARRQFCGKGFEKL